MPKPKFAKNERVRCLSADPEKKLIHRRVAVANDSYIDDLGNRVYQLFVYGFENLHEAVEDELESLGLIEDEEVLRQLAMGELAQVTRPTNAAQLYDSMAKAIIDQDFGTFCCNLSRWLEEAKSDHDIEMMLRQPIEAVAQAHGIAADIWPKHFVVQPSENTTFDELVNSIDNLSNKVSSSNYRDWVAISFFPDEQDDLGIDGWMDLYLLIVEEAGTLRIGHIEVEDID